MHLNLKNKKGQSMIEYLLLTAMIGIGTLGIVRLLGHSIAGKFAQMTNAIQGKATHADFQSVDKRLYEKKDMRDFMNGAVAKEK